MLVEVDVLKYGWMGVIIYFYSYVTILASCPGRDHESECLVTNQFTADADSDDACTEKCILGFGKPAVKLCQEINSEPFGY